MTTQSTKSEFDLIHEYFTGLTHSRSDVTLGIGDDGALLRVPDKMELVVSIDTLVAGVHFFADVSPQALGHKALAVNLSDLAAMGAEPAWVTLALTLPEVDNAWLKGFAQGFAALAQEYNVALVGGDTTRGPLAVSVQAHGWVPEGRALRRDGARAGDDIYVTGYLGDAALCLLSSQNPSAKSLFETLRYRLERPQPRIEAGLALRGIATSAIDISDGLAADLGHILQASGLGASISLVELPLSEPLSQWLQAGEDWNVVVAGGDDYELCFTADPVHRADIDQLGQTLGLSISRIGNLERQPGLRIVQEDGELWQGPVTGFDHFAGKTEESGES
jgi:thiamine-monophosphate kinase